MSDKTRYIKVFGIYGTLLAAAALTWFYAKDAANYAILASIIIISHIAFFLAYDIMGRSRFSLIKVLRVSALIIGAVSFFIQKLLYRSGRNFCQLIPQIKG